MPEWITHHLFFKLCVFFHRKSVLYCLIVFFLFIPVISAFSEEQPVKDEGSLQPKSETIYIIPDQTDVFLKFGVAITPDQYYPFRYARFSDSHADLSGQNERNGQSADVSTVVRIALDEFKCFSGLSHWIHGVEKTLKGYSRKMMLTGELNLDSYKTDPADYLEKVNLTAEIFNSEQMPQDQRNKIVPIIRQFEVHQVTWNMGFSLHSPELTFKLDIGNAFEIFSSVGEDVAVGAMIKLSI